MVKIIPFQYFMGLKVTGTLDLIYRKQKYQDYLSRLESLKHAGTTPVQQSKQEYIDINNQLTDQLQSIKQLTDKAIVAQGYYILGIPVTLLLLHQAYIAGFSLGAIFLILLITFFMIAHTIMKSLIALNKTLTPIVEVDNADMPSYLISKMSYVNSGLDIKKYRVLLLGLFYVLFFPALLYYGFNLLNHSLTSSTIWLISFVLSTGYWIFYFKNRLEPVTDIEVELSIIDRELTQLIA